jgi:hypothetical protein
MAFNDETNDKLKDVIEKCSKNPSLIYDVSDLLLGRTIYYIAKVISPSKFYYANYTVFNKETKIKTFYIPFCLTEDEANNCRERLDLQDTDVHVIPEICSNLFISVDKDNKNACLNPFSEDCLYFNAPIIQIIVDNLYHPDRIIFNRFVEHYTNIFTEKNRKIIKSNTFQNDIIKLTDIAQNCFSDNLEFSKDFIKTLKNLQLKNGNSIIINILWSIYNSLAIHLFVMIFHENNFSRNDFLQRTGLIITPLNIDNSDLLNIESTFGYKIKDSLNDIVSINFVVLNEIKKIKLTSIEYNITDDQQILTPKIQ